MYIFVLVLNLQKSSQTRHSYGTCRNAEVQNLKKSFSRHKNGFTDLKKINNVIMSFLEMKWEKYQTYRKLHDFLVLLTLKRLGLIAPPPLYICISACWQVRMLMFIREFIFYIKLNILYKTNLNIFSSTTCIRVHQK